MKTENINNTIQKLLEREGATEHEINVVKAFAKADSAFEASVKEIAEISGWEDGKIIQEITKRRLTVLLAIQGPEAVNDAISDAKQLMADNVSESVCDA